MNDSAPVVVVTTSWPSPGDDAAGHFVLAEAKLAAASRSVRVYAPGSGDAPSPSIEVRGLGGGALFGSPGMLSRLHERPWRVWHLARFFWRLRSEIKRDIPDPKATEFVVHWLVPGALMLSFIVPSSLNRKGKRTAVGHGTDVRLLLALPYRLRSGVLNRLRVRGFQLRMVSAALKEELVHSVACPQLTEWLLGSVVAPSPIAIPDAVLEWSAAERHAFLTHSGVDLQKPLLVVVGRLVPGKDVEAALSATAQAGSVFVIGAGPQLEALREAFPNVRFLGQLPRIETLKWIAAADLLVSASRAEGAPTAVREALALGTHVAARRVGDLSEQAKQEPLLQVCEGAPSADFIRQALERAMRSCTASS